jgi:voltage-gated potassium channel
MRNRANVFASFVRYFIRYALHVREVLVSLLVLVIIGGFGISVVEKMGLGKAIYFACVTGLTIGYGDITPKTVWGRVLSIVIGLIGLLFTGITVAIANRALRDLAEHGQMHE